VYVHDATITNIKYYTAQHTAKREAKAQSHVINHAHSFQATAHSVDILTHEGAAETPGGARTSLLIYCMGQCYRITAIGLVESDINKQKEIKIKLSGRNMVEGKNAKRILKTYCC